MAQFIFTFIAGKVLFICDGQASFLSKLKSHTVDVADEFIREYELENELGTIFLSQKELGDVSCVVWDAALVLAKYLEKRCIDSGDFLNGKNIIELGSGLGCVGLVASCYGAHVTLTDLPSTVPQLRSNMISNEKLISKQKGSVKIVPLDWNEKFDIKPPDMLLFADCVYYEEAIPGLINTITQLCDSKTEIFLSQENRSYSEIQTQLWGQFCDKIQKYFKLEFIPLREQHEVYSSPDIFVLHMKKL